MRSPMVLSIPHSTQDIPHGTHDISHGTDHPTLIMISPTVLNIFHSTRDILHGTEHTLDRVFTSFGFTVHKSWKIYFFQNFNF